MTKRPGLFFAFIFCSMYSFSQDPALSNNNHPDSILENYRVTARFLNKRFVCSIQEGDSLRKLFCSLCKLPKCKNCRINHFPDSARFRVNMITEKSFDTLFKNILSNVFVGSNDLVQNTTASGFTQDAEKGTLSINYSVFGSEERKSLWNIGMFSKSSDGIFGIYSADAWSSEVGFTIGLSLIKGKTRFFLPDTCRILRRKRTAYIRTLLTRYESVLKNNIAKIDYSIDSIKTVQANALDLQPAPDFAALEKQLNTLDSIKSQIDRLKPKSGNIDSFDLYKNVLEIDIADFEKTNASFSGYKFWWISPTFSLSNNKIQAKTDSLVGEIKSNFTARNTAKILLGVNFHRLHESKSNFQYYTIALQFGLRNFLDQTGIKDPYLKLDQNSNKVMVYNKDNKSLVDYDFVGANIKTFEPSFYYSIFFISKKTIGWDARVSYRALLDKPDAINKDSYPDLFNVTMGPIFRLKKEEGLNKGTIGIEAGIIDAPVKSSVWDYFGAKLKVGIPVNALIK